ncbi:aromatic prenyltransferase (TdiB protein) [Colletotrichum truncatum]|uniref:Aromatic prenyltransferase (TdiB protein) n=1 Tax=Colletotrichum truncatum TaxID=5467 RepID=A0ACC3YGT8_COLTU|nr:aromatic prenyltransferase (TdiB protein) [Colletotrichum truncatum]KAF6784103.1 aromatic prenyltransferase (TdiB protein) [Colletotrichum truncatum]
MQATASVPGRAGEHGFSAAGRPGHSPLSGDALLRVSIPSPPTNSDHRFWWDHFAPFMLSWLNASGCYSDSDIAGHLTILRDVVIPSFGPPSVVQHALKPAGSPFEMSWKFTPKGSSIRYIFQPMGARAGTEEDPFGSSNLDDEVLPLVEKHSPDVDLRWFRQFRDAWMMHRHHADAAAAKEAMKQHADVKIPCQVFLGYDLEGSRALFKAYFLPVFKHFATGRSTDDLAVETIRGLEPYGQELEGQILQLEEFLKECKYPHFVDMVGIDCCDPATARIKVYVRIDNVSRACVKYFVTRGGRLDDEQTRQMLGDIDRWWHHVIDEEDGLKEEQDKKPKTPATFHKGIVVAITLSKALKDGVVRVRPYCPWSNYQSSDWGAVANFAAILKELGMGDAAETYVKGCQAAANSV